MCLGLAGRIIERSPDQPELARVDVDGVVRVVNVSLLEDDPPGPGDWVLIHLGFALERLTEAEARENLETAAMLRAPEATVS